MLNILSNSGASTNIEAIAGASISILERGFKPNVIDGNSSGALIAPLLAMGRTADLKHFVLNYKIEDAFSVSPINKKGKPSAAGIFRAATGRASLGKMDALYCTLKEAFTEADFKKWKTSETMPEIYTATVEYKTGKLFKTRLRSIDKYEDAIKYIIASASIPIMAEPVKINGGLHFDGGARTHTLAPYMQRLYKGNIARHISIYSRPKNFSMQEPNLKEKVLPIAERTLEIMVTELSKANEREEIENRKAQGLALNDMLFMPYLLKNETYDFGNNEEKYNVGYKQALNIVI